MPGAVLAVDGKDEKISKLEKELQAVKSEVQSMKENPPKKKQKLTEGQPLSCAFKMRDRLAIRTHSWADWTGCAAWRQVAKTPLGFSFQMPKPLDQPLGNILSLTRGPALCTQRTSTNSVSQRVVRTHSLTHTREQTLSYQQRKHGQCSEEAGARGRDTIITPHTPRGPRA
eukprot:7363759-Pyramimonas_sp.AAC.1